MDLFNLFAKITLDDGEYVSAIERAGKMAKSFGKIAVAGIGAASVAIGKLGKASLDGYAQFEQLAGGVETLFGGAADIIGSNAAEAFKKAGLSANEYMETVTSFSASLIKSLGGDTKAAATIADQAIIDMADNANKMGTSMESIQNAYQGFAKANYTMLDNLKLGYGGTQAEMERLLEDAEKLSGKKFDISSYADIVQAIHVVQEEMGIAGATALEASTTIEGSINTMKAAWKNLQVSFASEDLFPEKRAQEFADSVVSVADNIVPRLQTILPSISKGLSTVVDKLLGYVPETLNKLLPSLVSGAASLVESFAGVIPEVLVTAVQAIPQLAEAAVAVVKSFAEEIINAVPIIASAGWEVVNMLADGILNGLPVVIEKAPKIIDNFLDTITYRLGDVMEKGIELTERLSLGIIDAIPDLVAKLPEIIQSITDFFVENFPKIVQQGGVLLGKLLSGILGAIPEIAKQLPSVISAIVNALRAGLPAIRDAGRYLLEGLWNGISDKVAWLKSKVAGVVEKIKSWFTGKDGFDEHSPSKWAAQVFRYVMEGGAEGLEQGLPKTLSTVHDTINTLKAGLAIDPAVIGFADSGMGSHVRSMDRAVSERMFGGEGDIRITVQSVLDGRIIAESVTKYQRIAARSMGRAW